MSAKELEKRLYNIFNRRYVYLEEYQDKYYFMKQVQELFPDLSDEKIYEAIDFTRNMLSTPIRRADFVRLFSIQILNE